MKEGKPSKTGSLRRFDWSIMSNKNNLFYSSSADVFQQIAPRTIPVYAPGRIEAREKVRVRGSREQARLTPTWIVFAALLLLSFAACVALNFKSQLEMREEQQKLNQTVGEVEQLKSANSAIFDELYKLQNDPATIERNARQRLSMMRANEKVLISAP